MLSKSYIYGEAVRVVPQQEKQQHLPTVSLVLRRGFSRLWVNHQALKPALTLPRLWMSNRSTSPF